MNRAALFAGIRDGNYHAGGIRCLRLFKLDETYFSELRSEVERLCATEQPSDVRKLDHVTNWTRPRGTVLQFSLLNASGRYDDFSTDHQETCFGKWFHAAENYPTVAHLISTFPDTLNFRINVLGPNARLSAHEEHSIIRTVTGSVSMRVRFHLPVITSPRAELMLDGWVYHLQPGTIYFVNHGCVHSARNGGDQARVHLVWDMLLTREAYDCVFGDEPCAPTLLRIAEDRQTAAPLRTERIGAHLRLPPLVPGEEAHLLDWCEPQ
jgi:hypothetical protein